MTQVLTFYRLPLAPRQQGLSSPPHQYLFYTPDGGNKDTFTAGVTVPIFAIFYVVKYH